MAATTIIHKITNAVAKIGLANGTKVTEPDYTGKDKSNSARDLWFAEWRAMCEYMVAKTITSIGEKREKAAKEALLKIIDTDKIKVGNAETIVRSNVAIYFQRRNAPRRINPQTVTNVLMRPPYNWKPEEIEKLMLEINVSSPDGSLWITPSTTME